MESHVKEVYLVSQKTLQGILSGPLLQTLLVNAMQSSQRVTLGQIVVDEAWDMAEALVNKFETKLSQVSA